MFRRLDIKTFLANASTWYVSFAGMDVSFSNVVESTRQYFQGVPTPGGGAGQNYGATPFWPASYQQKQAAAGDQQPQAQQSYAIREGSSSEHHHQQTNARYEYIPDRLVSISEIIYFQKLSYITP